MTIRDPEAWVKAIERLYWANDAEGLSAMYTDDATTRYASSVMGPDWVHSHPRSWFESLQDYRLSRSFRAATGDVIVSETRASYIWRPTAAPEILGPDAKAEEAKEPGQRYREYGADIYWVNASGRIYHKHTIDMVEPYGLSEPQDPEH